jgi:hypothetical protein
MSYNCKKYSVNCTDGSQNNEDCLQIEQQDLFFGKIVLYMYEYNT